MTFTASALIVMVIALGFAWPHINHYMLTGRLFPIDRIESLISPVSVRGWDASGLWLSDGRHVQLPEFSKLPAQSEALSEATKRGVELSWDGRVYGLVRVHHWCGNDPVREHVARVDLSHMLTFLQEGERLAPPGEAEMLAREAGGQFSEWGWRVGEFGEFQMYSKYFSGEPDAVTNGSQPIRSETDRASSAAGSRR